LERRELGPMIVAESVKRLRCNFRQKCIQQQHRELIGTLRKRLKQTLRKTRETTSCTVVWALCIRSNSGLRSLPFYYYSTVVLGTEMQYRSRFHSSRTKIFVPPRLKKTHQVAKLTATDCENKLASVFAFILVRKGSTKTQERFRLPMIQAYSLFLVITSKYNTKGPVVVVVSIHCSSSREW
jgi:hypothetical protein